MSEVIVTVRGENEARVAPEEAVVRLAIRAEGPERGTVVEQVAARAVPLREELDERKAAGTVREWSSQRVSVWANRPWNDEGKQLALVHYASVEVTATFTDFAALSWWITSVAERDGVQVNGVEWRLSAASAKTAEAAVAASAVRVAVDRATAYAAAIGLSTVTPLEIADLGLLTQHAQGGRESASEMMRIGSASFAADSSGGATIDLQPDDILVTAAVEARFGAS